MTRQELTDEIVALCVEAGYDDVEIDVRGYITSALNDIHDDYVSNQEHCALCDEVMTPCGDNWDDLCPGCADKVSEYMDEHRLSDDEAGRDKAIEAIRDGCTDSDCQAKTKPEVA